MDFFARLEAFFRNASILLTRTEWFAMQVTLNRAPYNSSGQIDPERNSA
jgi:hypothetical protein